MKKIYIGVIAVLIGGVAAINVSMNNSYKNNQRFIKMNLKNSVSLTRESACDYTAGYVMGTVSRETGDYVVIDGVSYPVRRDVSCCVSSSINNACNTYAENSLC